MTPSMKKLSDFSSLWVVIGPMGIVIGGVFAVGLPSFVVVIALIAMSLSFALFLGAIVAKVVVLGVQASDELARARVAEERINESDRPR